jgi:hypothetical protein
MRMAIATFDPVQLGAVNAQHVSEPLLAEFA